MKPTLKKKKSNNNNHHSSYLQFKADVLDSCVCKLENLFDITHSKGIIVTILSMKTQDNIPPVQKPRQRVSPLCSPAEEWWSSPRIFLPHYSQLPEQTGMGWVHYQRLSSPHFAAAQQQNGAGYWASAQTWAEVVQGGGSHWVPKLNFFRSCTSTFARKHECGFFSPL